MLEKIVELLHENARMTDEEIAGRIGATPAEVATKIEEARRAGTIRGYRVITSDDALPSSHVVSMVEVGLTPERERGFDRVAERVARFPEVVSCALMSGTYDLLVQVRGRSLQDVATFISERLATMEGVRSTRTHFVLKRYKDDGVLLFAEPQVERLLVSP